ncbi:MAG: hypothetical protein K0V04_41900 [Deltaproteobacteria bacterium]|nr:hypothetical protein [Deltaproteobacteria bacterium]
MLTTRIRTAAAALAASISVVVCACGPDAPGTGETTTAATGTAETDDAGATDTDTPNIPNDTEAPPPATDTGVATGETGGIDGPLAECEPQLSCPMLDIYCDFDGCGNDYASPEADCALQALAASWSGTPARVVNVAGGGTLFATTLLALGDGQVLVEEINLDLGDITVEQCQLQPAQWFLDCVGTVSDECYVPELYVDNDTCVVLEAPMCPPL